MWEIILFISLLVGQLGRIQITSDIAFYFHDIVIFCYLLFHIRALFHLEWKKVELAKPLAIVFGVCFLSLIENLWRFQLIDIAVGVLYLLRFYMYVSVLMFVLLSKKSQSYWLHWLYFLGVSYAVIGFFQLLFYPNLRNIAYLGWDPHYYRLFSTLFDPNFVGLIFVLSFFLGLYLVQTHKKQKWLLMAGEGVLFIALLLTYSRSSFLAAIIGGCIYILLIKKWKLLFALVIFGLGIFLLPAFGGISTSVFRMWSVNARLSNWQEGSALFFNSPIIGYGFNTLRSVAKLGTTSPYGYIANAGGGIDNSILFILVTTGVIGLAVFANLGICLIRSGLCITKQPLRAVYFSIFTALIIHSMFVNSLFYPQILIWFWIFVFTSRS